MNKNRLNLYRVDKKYIRDLHNADDKVLSVSPQIGKQNREYEGILVVCNDVKYIVPISHAKSKHTTMKNSADLEKIYDKNGKFVAVLNFNLMIPINETQLEKVDLNISDRDNDLEKAYKRLCINEIEFCRKRSKIIMDKAKTIYDLCTKKESNYKGKSRCLDFKKLEKVCNKYNEKGRC